MNLAYCRLCRRKEEKRGKRDRMISVVMHICMCSPHDQLWDPPSSGKKRKCGNLSDRENCLTIHGRTSSRVTPAAVMSFKLGPPSSTIRHIHHLHTPSSGLSKSDIWFPCLPNQSFTCQATLNRPLLASSAMKMALGSSPRRFVPTERESLAFVALCSSCSPIFWCMSIIPSYFLIYPIRTCSQIRTAWNTELCAPLVVSWFLCSPYASIAFSSSPLPNPRHLSPLSGLVFNLIYIIYHLPIVHEKHSGFAPASPPWRTSVATELLVSSERP